jgi:hypothetical protein
MPNIPDRDRPARYRRQIRARDPAINGRVCDDSNVPQVGDDETRLILTRGSGAQVVASDPERPYDDAIVDYRVEVFCMGLSADTVVTSLGADALDEFLVGLAERFAGVDWNSHLAQSRRSAARRSRVGQPRPRDADDQASTTDV